jgi:hypothetical protein
VIREGNLAPSRDIVWFTEPTADERAFLRRQDAALRDLLTGTLATDDGRAFLHEVLLPPAPDQEEEQDASDVDVDAAIGRAFDGDFALAASVSMVLSEIAPPGDPLVPHLPAAARRAPQADDLFTVVARYALGRILPDPARAAEWQSTRRVLADFGYQLTDRGMRRGRNAVEQLLATSAAKDAAAVQKQPRGRERPPYCSRVYDYRTMSWPWLLVVILNVSILRLISRTIMTMSRSPPVISLRMMFQNQPIRFFRCKIARESVTEATGQP